MKTTNLIHGPAAPVTNTIHHQSSVNVIPIIGHHLCPLCHLLCHQFHVHTLSKQKLQCHQLRRLWAHRFLINSAVSDALEILKRPFRLELINRRSHTIEAAVIREAAAGPVRHQDGVAAAPILDPGLAHGHRLDDVVADHIHGPDLVRVAQIHVIAGVGEVELIIGQGKSEYTFTNVYTIYFQLASQKILISIIFIINTIYFHPRFANNNRGGRFVRGGFRNDFRNRGRSRGFGWTGPRNNRFRSRDRFDRRSRSGSRRSYSPERRRDSSEDDRNSKRSERKTPPPPPMPNNGDNNKSMKKQFSGEASVDEIERILDKAKKDNKEEMIERNKDLTKRGSTEAK